MENPGLIFKLRFAYIKNYSNIYVHIFILYNNTNGYNYLVLFQNKFMLGKNASLTYGTLMSSGHQTVSNLIRRTGLSQPVLSRALNEIAHHTNRLVKHRQGRSIVYAISKAVRSLPVAIPVHQVAPTGIVSLMGTLTALEGGGYLYLAANERSELFEGLPWFLQDMRPQGFIGRSFRDAYAHDLGLSDNLAEWTDDDVLYTLSEFGEDAPGNLLIGNNALRRFQAVDYGIQVPPNNLAFHYDRMADAALQGGVPGSSAGGEHPKFLLQHKENDGARNVIVKFSPLLDGSPTATRWKDLLIAEHVASGTLGGFGIAVPDTRIVLTAKRCYLESARYDRVGPKGRIAAASFEAIDNGFIGARSSWSASASALRAQGMITSDCEEQIKLVEQFGRCIANTDMHFGNLSFFLDMQDAAVKLRLAPIYDMLPMLYAPEKSEVVDRIFKSPLPAEAGKAGELARLFWNDVASRDDVSGGFRKIAAANAALLADR